MKSRQTLTHCFLNTDLRCQHDGLTLIAKKRRVDVMELPTGEHVIFINTNQNKMKMFSPGGVLSYLRLKTGKIDLNTLAKIPQSFGEGIEVAYSRSLRKVLREKLDIH